MMLYLSEDVAETTSHEDLSSRDVVSTSASPSSLVQQVYSTGHEICACCHLFILEQYMLILEGQAYHPSCLRCCLCYNELGIDLSCFCRDQMTFCKMCYISKFRRSCEKCGDFLKTDDVVMRARDAIFHVNCFTCNVCGTLMNSGEFFVMNEKNELFCQVHHDILPPKPLDPQKLREPSEEQDDYLDDDQTGHSRSKRMRTSFKHHQLKTMKMYFNLNHNPDSKDLKQLAQKTGLTKRVLQVWFQNARAKYRRTMQGRDGHSLSPGLSSLTTSTLTSSSAPLSDVQSSSSGQSSDYMSTSPDYEMPLTGLTIKEL